MNLETNYTIDSINALIDSQGVTILENKKVFLHLLKDVVLNTTDEQRILCVAVEKDALNLLGAAIRKNTDINKVRRDLVSFINKALVAHPKNEKEFAVQVFIGVYAHCTGKVVQQELQPEADDQIISRKLAGAARFSKFMNGVSEGLPLVLNPVLWSVIILVAMEIAAIVCLVNTDVVQDAMDESVGTFFVLQLVLIVHALIGAVLSRIAQMKWLSFIPMGVSVMTIVYSFFYAMGSLEGFVIKALGFVFFGAIALVASTLCVLLSRRIVGK